MPGESDVTAPAQSFPVSWDQFHRDARALAWRLAASGPFQGLVCITRGGLVPAAIVSRELGIRVIETVCVASYHDYTSQGELQVVKGIADQVHKLGGGDGTGLLVIDDLVDTGKTARIVRDMFPKPTSPPSTPSRSAGRWWIRSSRKCHRIHGSISHGTWAFPISRRSPRATRADRSIDSLAASLSLRFPGVR